MLSVIIIFLFFCCCVQYLNKINLFIVRVAHKNSIRYGRGASVWGAPVTGEQVSGE